eukprot:364455-Chlamydomonas_euryale.AAC.1
MAATLCCPTERHENQNNPAADKATAITNASNRCAPRVVLWRKDYSRAKNAESKVQIIVSTTAVDTEQIVSQRAAVVSSIGPSPPLAEEYQCRMHTGGGHTPCLAARGGHSAAPAALSTSRRSPSDPIRADSDASSVRGNPCWPTSQSAAAPSTPSP